MSESALLLIRHAESSWNAAGRWQGHADPPLSDRGRRQAHALARELARETIDVLASSDLLRAAETAAIVGRARGLPPQLNPRLRELDLGDWEGLTRDEIERKAAALLRRFDDADPEVRPGGGENLRELEQRAVAAVSELVEANPGRCVAVVTHLGVIRALLPESEFDNASWRSLSSAALIDCVARGRRRPERMRGANF